MSKIAENYGVDCKITLTGFKWISKLISEIKILNLLEEARKVMDI